MAQGKDEGRHQGRRATATALVVAVTVAALLVSVPSAAAATFSNATPITTTDPETCTSPLLPGSPYPSSIVASGLTGTVSDVNVTLRGMNHFPGDFEILLVGPGGGAQNLVLFSDAGTVDVTNFTLTLDDQAPAFVPIGGAPTSPAKPTDYNVVPTPDAFPSPAPAVANRPGGAPGATHPGGGTATLASVFNGIAPNGTWQLFVITDDCTDPAETMTGGWTLNVTTSAGASTTTAVSSAPNPSATGQSVTFTVTVTSGASPVTSGTVTFTEGATPLASNAALNASGQASFSTSSLGEGDHTITATYNGVAAFSTSNGSINQRVDNDTVVTGSTYCNPGPLTINAVPTAIATPYPSNVVVSGSSSVGKVTATLKNVSHTHPDDSTSSSPAPMVRT